MLNGISDEESIGLAIQAYAHRQSAASDGWLKELKGFKGLNTLAMI